MIIVSIIAAKKSKRAAMRRVFLNVILVSILLLSIVSIMKIHRYRSHVVEPKAYESIGTGMSREKVVELLGEPSKKEEAIWRYSKPGVWEFVEINFDSEGKVRSKFRDS